MHTNKRALDPLSSGEQSVAGMSVVFEAYTRHADVSRIVAITQRNTFAACGRFHVLLGLIERVGTSWRRTPCGDKLYKVSTLFLVLLDEGNPRTRLAKGVRQCRRHSPQTRALWWRKAKDERGAGAGRESGSGIP